MTSPWRRWPAVGRCREAGLGLVARFFFELEFGSVVAGWRWWHRVIFRRSTHVHRGRGHLAMSVGLVVRWGLSGYRSQSPVKRISSADDPYQQPRLSLSSGCHPTGGLVIYLRFGLSLRDVEDILAERGIEFTFETIGCWVDRLGSQIANRIRSCRPRPTAKGHLDEMFVSIAVV